MGAGQSRAPRPTRWEELTFIRLREPSILDATSWYLERNSNAGAEFVREIEHALSRIHEVPERYPMTQYHCRRFVLLKFPFNIIFRILDHEVEIIAVAHHSRRPGYWRSR